MKITFEEGDVCEVEDNTDAGKFAADCVQLIRRNGSNTWFVEDVLNPNKKGTVEERYLIP